MSPKLLGASIAYLAAGTVFIEALNLWMPFQAAFGIGTVLCFLIALFAKLGLKTIAVLGGLFCLLLYIDNSLSLYWISDVKQYDWTAILGSGAFFSIPGFIANGLAGLLSFANQRLKNRPK